MQPNQLTAIIGVILLVVAGSGLATVQEKPRTPVVSTHKYTLTFQMSAGTQSASASVTDGASQTVQINVKDYNLTVFALAAKWTDNKPLLVTQSATVMFQLTDPAGKQAGTAQGTDGSAGIAMVVPENAVPSPDNITASNEAKAWQEVLRMDPPATNGTGDWKLTISCQRGGFHPLRSGSVTVTIGVGYEFYLADLKEAGK
jgi:hypothetical protein